MSAIEMLRGNIVIGGGMSVSKIFRADDGMNYFVTFVLVGTLFLLWGTCNGVIDVMDKHFQDLFGSITIPFHRKLHPI